MCSGLYCDSARVGAEGASPLRYVRSGLFDLCLYLQRSTPQHIAVHFMSVKFYVEVGTERIQRRNVPAQGQVLALVLNRGLSDLFMPRREAAGASAVGGQSRHCRACQMRAF